MAQLNDEHRTMSCGELAVVHLSTLHSPENTPNFDGGIIVAVARSIGPGEKKVVVVPPCSKDSQGFGCTDFLEISFHELEVLPKGEIPEGESLSHSSFRTIPQQCFFHTE